MSVGFDSITFSVPMFFREDLSPDYATLERYLADCCASTGVEVLYGMTYNTRYCLMSDDEIVAVNRLILSAAKSAGKAAIVGHPFATTTDRLPAFLERLADLDPWAISVLPPERYFGDDAPFLAFLAAPAQVGLKTFVHEMKLVSGFDGSLVNWPNSLLDAALSAPNVVGVKEDSKDDAISARVIQRCAAEKHVVLAGGGKVRAQQFLDAGLRSWLNGSLMLRPQAAAKTYRAFTGRDAALTSMYLQQVETPYFSQVVARFGWHVAHKAALEAAGYGRRFERGPMTSMPENDFETIRPIVAEIVEGLSRFDD